MVRTNATLTLNWCINDLYLSQSMLFFSTLFRSVKRDFVAYHRCLPSIVEGTAVELNVFFRLYPSSIVFAESKAA